MQLLNSALALLLAAPIFGADGTPTINSELRVHEWGTFTSVAGENGEAQPWMSLAGAPDLPCFVYHLSNRCIKCGAVGAPKREVPTITSLVRMETPVLYFYSQQPKTISVKVDFPQGWISEWYPQASSVSPQLPPAPATELPAIGGGQIVWDHVMIRPGSKVEPLTGQGASHYYAARATDSQPIDVMGQAEKLIFYRGVANFPVPLAAKVLDDSKIELRSPDVTLPLAILFENRAGQIGFRAISELRGDTTIAFPSLTANLDELKQKLANSLIDAGLYEKEAQAMIETWRDSWFEEGMRVFYLMPRRSVDQALRLTVEPAPAATERVFVGRVEILSPFLRESLSKALATGDTATLAKYGRFLEPFAARIPGGSTLNPATAAFFKARYDEARRDFDNPTCVR
jgi:hypothetical protein